MELMSNRTFTDLWTDNVKKYGCSTVYSFGIYCFYMQVIWISNTLSKTLHCRRCICTYNWKIPARQRHFWDRLSWQISLPVSAGKFLQEGPYSYFLISLLPSAVVKSIVHAISVAHTIFIAVVVPLFYSPGAKESEGRQRWRVEERHNHEKNDSMGNVNGVDNGMYDGVWE